MISPPDEQTVARLAQQALPGGTVRRSWALSGGISAGMQAVEVGWADGRSQTVIVRTHAQAALAEKEYQLLQILVGWDIKSATPYLLDRANHSLVLGYLPGQMSFTPHDLSHHLQQMATQLAYIHQLDAAQYDLSFLPEVGETCSELGRELPFPNPNFPREPEIRQRLAEYELAHAFNKPTLLHGDFWPGNCLWQAGELTAVIDWEDACIGDPLIDLAQSRSEIAWIFGPEAVEIFTGHYRQQLPIDERQLPYWDLCAALRQIRLVGADLVGFAAYFGGYGRSDITPTTICQNLKRFIDHALARLGH
ncbi:MAG: phosphotransferase [Ardenticatenaceae bacterium]|nr:phosphotransferase [Ardenticatenaceae bacterium]